MFVGEKGGGVGTGSGGGGTGGGSSNGTSSITNLNKAAQNFGSGAWY